MELFEEMGDALEGLALLGVPGGVAYLLMRQRGLGVAEGMAADGGWCELLSFWEGDYAIARTSPEGLPTLSPYPDGDAAWAAWGNGLVAEGPPVG